MKKAARQGFERLFNIDATGCDLLDLFKTAKNRKISRRAYELECQARL